jgi:alpha-galactosidase
MSLALLAAVTAAFSFGEVKISCEKPCNWTFDLVREVAPDGAEIAKIAIQAPKAAVPPKFTLSFPMPQVGMDYTWSVNDNDMAMRPNWAGWKFSSFGTGLPVYVYFDGRDTSHLAVAASECTRGLGFSGGVREEGSVMDFKFVFFDSNEAPISRYEASVRIDTQAKPFADAVRASVAWAEKAGGYVPCRAPEAAFEPLYSTWYNFHQNVFAKDIEAELEIAAKLGMKTIIVDDGWQTDDTNRGYAFCGDWEISRRRFPDMAAHVKRAHALGVKYMVWYSVPFIGHKSANFARFKGKYLTEDDRGLNAAVLDPRFPEVRKFLVDTYVTALKEWDIDGFKLDFVDTFDRHAANVPATDGAGRDMKSVPLAVERLMKEISAALTAIKPDVLIEFRQSYVGPGIRQCGNMIRVGDCPGDMRRNRVAIANLRLAGGGSAVHSDMLEWNFKASPEEAARFIVNSMFGVVQYSVMLRDAPPEHRAVIEKWIRFSRDHRETLLKGRFTPHHPELLYPVIEAESDAERIVGLYDDGRVVDVPDDKKTIVMNASGKDSFVFRRGGKLVAVDCKSGDWVEL